MKPSQLAKGFKARPDTTSSEKRTALDRLNAIDGIVDMQHVSQAAANGRSSAFVADDQLEAVAGPESEEYRAWRRANRYAPGQVVAIQVSGEVVGPPGLEPGTSRLKVACSTD